MSVKETKAVKRQARLSFLQKVIERVTERIKVLKREIIVLENDLEILKELLKDARKGK